MTQNREGIEENSKTISKAEINQKNTRKMVFHQQISICLKSLTINSTRAQKEQSKQEEIKNKKDFHQYLKPENLCQVLNQQNLDQMLRLFNLYGNQWSKIAQQLNTKQSRKVKEFYYVLFRKSIRKLTKHLRTYKAQFNYAQQIPPNIITKLTALSQNRLKDHFKTSKKTEIDMSNILHVKSMWIQYLKTEQKWEKDKLDGLIHGLLSIHGLCRRRKIKKISIKPIKKLSKKNKKKILRLNLNPINTRRQKSILQKLRTENQRNQQKKQTRKTKQRQWPTIDNNVKLQENYEMSNIKKSQIKIEQQPPQNYLPCLNNQAYQFNHYRIQRQPIPRPPQIEPLNPITMQQLNIGLLFSYLNQMNPFNNFNY